MRPVQDGGILCSEGWSRSGIINMYEDLVEKLMPEVKSDIFQNWTGVEDVDSKEFLEELRKIPNYTGIAFRGLAFTGEKEKKDFLKKFSIGSIWQNENFMSSSKKRRIALEFANYTMYQVLLIIESLTGKDISEFSKREQEVIFLSGCSFRVSNIKQVKNRYHTYRSEIFLKEVGSGVGAEL